MSKLECTCDLRHELAPPKYIDHAGTCDLWFDDDFASGLCDWDPATQKVIATLAGDLWGGDDLPNEPTDMQRIIDATVGGLDGINAGFGRGGYYRYNSCRHNMTEVRLPDALGTVVHCSASTDVRGRANRPDYAVYLHAGWTASSIATFIPWEDYGTPFVAWEQVRGVVMDFYARAVRGERVEVGCMGGHGRTGTFLAAVVMLADPNMTPTGAVAWVRKHYCAKAVEDRSQEYWLKWFSDPSLPAHYDRPVIVKKVAAQDSGPLVTSCDWTKKGKWCRKNVDHAGPHHYTLLSRRIVTVAVPVKAVAVDDARRCERVLDAAIEGIWRCSHEKGHSGNHSYRRWEGDRAQCENGFTGPCTMLAGHGGACVVRQAVSK